MALALDLIYKNVEVKGAYVTVAVVTLGTDKAEMNFSVQTCAEPNCEPLTYVYHTTRYDMDGENPFKQAYEYLKSLPEFEGATDC
ncbi:MULTISPECIES: hypothetical protein [Pseudomonas]|uniref:hypothetical protein n=1 Tax=Pseudomonas TaxID=286 RepID=UPI00103FAD65|nr:MULTISPECIES: hypothetical protein [Pseudomonas]MDR6581619.1 hypothetical protein [Pseudomonas extremaustralis]WLD68649.1 hypothetical protein QU606_08495 [Pseudomonas sp. OVF7]WLI52896.1 hypothetical protein PSH63_08980 [Pseudomonas sp. FP833]